jgi:hypothetical protein
MVEIGQPPRFNVQVKSCLSTPIPRRCVDGLQFAGGRVVGDGLLRFVQGEIGIAARDEREEVLGISRDRGRLILQCANIVV